jgi:CBS domain-containing protein
MALCAKDVMRTKVRSIGPEVSLADLERALLEARRTGFPVVKDGRLIGVVSQSDIVRKLATEQIYADYLSEYYRDIGGFEDAEPGDCWASLPASSWWASSPTGGSSRPEPRPRWPAAASRSGGGASFREGDAIPAARRGAAPGRPAHP